MGSSEEDLAFFASDHSSSEEGGEDVRQQQTQHEPRRRNAQPYFSSGSEASDDVRDSRRSLREGGGANKKGAAQADQRRQKKKSKPRSAPAEMDSSRPVSALRVAFNNKRFKPRDPRFGLSGDGEDEFDSTTFSHRYSFVDDLRKKELGAVRTQLKREKDEEERERLKEAAAKMHQDMKERERARESAALLRDWKKTERGKVSDGKTPYYLKKSAQRDILLREQFKQLEKTGGVEKFIRKKRKKRAARDRRIIPERRSRDTG